MNDMRRYTGREVDEMIARNHDAEAGARMIAMFICALSGFFVACIIFGMLA